MTGALLYYLIVINIVTFLVYGIDKWRSTSCYQRDARRPNKVAGAYRKLRADIGIDIDYETVGANGSMLMVATSGTAVVI